jgi:hypothetical protein
MLSDNPIVLPGRQAMNRIAMVLFYVLLLHNQKFAQAHALDPNTIAQNIERFSDAKLGIFIPRGIYTVNFHAS